jgi:hypothetical protein
LRFSCLFVSFLAAGLALETCSYNISSLPILSFPLSVGGGKGEGSVQWRYLYVTTRGSAAAAKAAAAAAAASGFVLLFPFPAAEAAAAFTCAAAWPGHISDPPRRGDSQRNCPHAISAQYLPTAPRRAWLVGREGARERGWEREEEGEREGRREGREGEGREERRGGGRRRRGSSQREKMSLSHSFSRCELLGCGLSRGLGNLLI